MYVVRNTLNAAADIQRNWSAWIGQDAETREALIDMLLDAGDISVEPSWFGLRRRDLPTDYDTNDIYQAADVADWDEFLAVVVENADVDIRYNDAWGRWQHVHHDGLSCYALTAETESEAVEQATAGTFPWHGFGDCTVGTVRVVRQITDTLWLFECDAVTREDC